MRLTLITETFPPEVNGVARTLGRWVDAFQKRGHQVQVIRPRRRKEPPRDTNVMSFPIPMYPQVRIGVTTPLRLTYRFSKPRTDLVHVATEGPLGLSALLAARCLGIPVASSFHTNFDHYLGHYGLGSMESLARGYLRWFHNRTAVTLVPSKSTAERLRSHGFRDVAIWSRGVDCAEFNPRFRDESLRRSLGLGPEDCLLLYVGRIAPEKNLPVLLESFARLRERLADRPGPRVLLALIGDGPLTATIREQSPPDVVLPGFMRGEALSRWYASGDVFAFPSLSETFGNVLLEAQASGLPVACFEGPVLGERVSNESDGLLVPSRPDGLTGPLEVLSRDREKRRRFGNAARLSAEQQDWDEIFDELEARYVEIVGRKKRPEAPRPQRSLSSVA